MKNKSLLYAMASAVIMAAGATSCNDYLDVNTNTDAPDYVEGYLYLAGIEQSYNEMYYDLRALAPMTQMMGTTSYTSFATHYYSKGSDAGGQAWRMVYWSQGMNLENMINQSVAAENWTLAGIGLAMKAYSWDYLTKLNGELPMKQAYVSGLLSHEYDYQEDIYPQVREWAKQAIDYLQREDNTNYGNRISNNDYIYKGNKEKWIKFAYAVIARNLASLTNKTDFKEKYYNDFIDAVGKSFASTDDDAMVTIEGGGAQAAQSAYNNFFGVYRGNLSYSYFQHDYAVQLFTGTIPLYNDNGDKMQDENHLRYRYELLPTQITSDTTDVAGHFDPRRLLKLGTADGNEEATTTDVEALRNFNYVGGSFTSKTGPIATAPSFWGRPETTTNAKDGDGRWLYHNDAPYILTTYAELMFDLAEVQYRYGSKADAFEAFKKGVAADMEFSAKFIKPGSISTISGKVYHQGDKVSAATFKQIANEYLAGPYVGGLNLADFTLSHIMMQKFMALYPWGASEVWVDQRKYMYDIEYTGEYPSFGNGYDKTITYMKKDTDPTKVFKGFYLMPANVQNRRSAYNDDNNGSPCFRIRPRYNSEYMWNKNNLDVLKPISGLALNYQCSIPWFAYPGNMPK